MQISWNGLGSFVFVGKVGQQDVTLVTDPYQNSTGLRFPRTQSASLVVQSHDGEMANNTSSLLEEGKKKPFVIEHAGEYEVRGLFATGIRAPKKDGTEHTIYRLGIEGMQIAFLGALDRDLTDAEVSALGNIDVLIVPVGGGVVMNKDVASEVVSQIEPSVVIPSHFSVPGLKEKLADVDPFCSELACPREDSKKIKLTRNSLPVEEIQIIVPSKG